jgi:S1/P1 Nuclease
MYFSSLVASAALATTALAWNTDVHNQIGFLAEEFLTPQTKSIIHQILEPEYHGSIGKAAAWADSYRKTTEGAFSSQWHYIDSQDSPPAVCNTYYNRDCTKGGCVISAIANQTEILRGCIADAKAGKIKGGKNIACSYALKWIVHFTGDIAQPLHASSLAIGGNSFDVTFNKVATNLHSVWDGSIIYASAKKTIFSNVTLDPFFASNILPKIKADRFFTPKSQWTTCTDPSTPVECALQWAIDTNIWNCDYVYSQNFNGTDLATSGYAEGAYPIVQIQISKAAVRLAYWLNKLASGRYDENRPVDLRVNPAWKEEL